MTILSVVFSITGEEAFNLLLILINQSTVNELWCLITKNRGRMCCVSHPSPLCSLRQVHICPRVHPDPMGTRCTADPEYHYTQNTFQIQERPFNPDHKAVLITDAENRRGQIVCTGYATKESKLSICFKLQPWYRQYIWHHKNNND